MIIEKLPTVKCFKCGGTRVFNDGKGLIGCYDCGVLTNKQGKYHGLLDDLNYISRDFYSLEATGFEMYDHFRDDIESFDYLEEEMYEEGVLPKITDED